MSKKMLALALMTMAGTAAGAVVGSASTSRPSQLPTRLISVHADTATAPDAQGASVTELARRSFDVPGVRDVLLVKVTAVRGSLAIARDSKARPIRIVTDYQIAVLRVWARGRVSSIPTLLRLPGGVVDGSMEKFEDAPTVAVGNEYLVWDQAQPPGAAAGPSQPDTAVVPSKGNIASLSPAGLADWAGKTVPLQAMESALAQAAGG